MKFFNTAIERLEGRKIDNLITENVVLKKW